jgi:hypothetical protein
MSRSAGSLRRELSDVHDEDDGKRTVTITWLDLSKELACTLHPATITGTHAEAHAD